MSGGSELVPRSRVERWRLAARLIRDLVRIHPRPFLVAVGGAAIFALCTVASAIVLRWVIDHVIEPRFRDGRVGVGTTIVGLTLVIVVGFVRAAGVVIRRTWAGRAHWRIAESLTVQVLDRLIA